MDPTQVPGISASAPTPAARRRLAVVLSGGGTLGAFQVGVIDALAGAGLVPDLIVGTSVGAFNGAFWALDPGPDAGQRLLRVWERCRRDTLLPHRLWSPVRGIVGRRDHLFSSEGLIRLIDRNTPSGARLEDLPVPLAVTVTDVAASQRRTLRRGGLRQAVLASASLPGVYPPVMIDGVPYADGALTANCDLEAVAESGIDQALVVDLAGRLLHPGRGHLTDVLTETLLITLHTQTDLALRAMRGRVAVAMARPVLDRIPLLDDFSLTEWLFGQGRQVARGLLAEALDGAGNVRPGALGALGPAAVASRDRLAG